MLNFGLDSDYKDLIAIFKQTKQGQKFLNDLEGQTQEVLQLREDKIADGNRIKTLENAMLEQEGVI